MFFRLIQIKVSREFRSGFEMHIKNWSAVCPAFYVLPLCRLLLTEKQRPAGQISKSAIAFR